MRTPEGMHVYPARDYRHPEIDETLGGRDI